jgi:hypothetical protein
MPHKPNHPVARHAPKSSLDDIPTPPWATRAFFQYVAPELLGITGLRYVDPAAGRGYMVQAVREKGVICNGYDIKDYKAGYPVRDFIDGSNDCGSYDVLITNPPYKLGNAFVERALEEAAHGVAILARTLWAEGGRDHAQSRYHRIFHRHPPNIIAIFCGRIPFAKGRVVRKKSMFISHSWFWWDLTRRCRLGDTRFAFIPPIAQAALERRGDYAKSYLTTAPGPGRPSGRRSGK